MNQKPQNPFKPGDRVIKTGDDDASVAVVVEVLPPEKDVDLYGQTMDGEAVSVAFPNMLDDGPGNWREIHPAKLASYCDDQDITLYTYKHTNLEHTENPFALGDYVIKPDYDDPDLAVVLSIADGDGDQEITIAFCKHLEKEFGEQRDVLPADLDSRCEEAGVNSYTYASSELAFKPQY